jgi:hypothetical protein
MFPKPHDMTAFNRMVHINKELFDGKRWDIIKVQIFAGGIYNPGITSAEAAGQSGESVVVVVFDGTKGDAADIPICVVHDEVSEQTFCAVEEKRESGSVRVPLGLPAGQSDLTKRHAFLVFSQPPVGGTTKSGLVLNTAYAGHNGAAQSAAPKFTGGTDGRSQRLSRGRSGVNGKKARGRNIARSPVIAFPEAFRNGQGWTQELRIKAGGDPESMMSSQTKP